MLKILCIGYLSLLVLVLVYFFPKYNPNKNQSFIQKMFDDNKTAKGEIISVDDRGISSHTVVIYYNYSDEIYHNKGWQFVKRQVVDKRILKNTKNKYILIEYSRTYPRLSRIKGSGIRGQIIFLEAGWYLIALTFMQIAVCSAILFW